MDVGLVSRVGLQLLLEPQSTAFVFRGACVAVGAVYPAYATYKTLVVPKRAASPSRSANSSSSSSSSSAAAVHSLEAERWLRYWTIFGLTVLAERLFEHQLDKVPFYPHAKLAFLLWLQLQQGYGASRLFDGYLTPWLSRYERKVDTLLEVGAQIMVGLQTTYAGPISYVRTSLSLALQQLAAFISWLTTPDEPPGGLDNTPTSHPAGGSTSNTGSPARGVLQGTQRRSQHLMG